MGTFFVLQINKNLKVLKIHSLAREMIYFYWLDQDREVMEVHA